MIKAKIISSLEKCFVGDDVDKFEQIKSITALKNERFSFQIVISADNEDIPRYFFADLDIGGKVRNRTHSGKRSVAVPVLPEQKGRRLFKLRKRAVPRPFTADGAPRTSACCGRRNAGVHGNRGLTR